MPEHPELKFRSTVELLQNINRDMPRIMGYEEAGGRDDFDAWQQQARQKLIEIIGFLPETVIEPESWKLDEEPADGFVRQKWAMESPFGDHILFYRLVPEESGEPQRLLLALHGHGDFGADAVVGIDRGRPGETEHLHDTNYAFGAAFARRGFLVYAPCHRGFNQRSDHGDPAEVQQSNSCVDINARAILLGSSDLALRLQDIMHLIGWIRRRPGEGDIPLGCVGLSGGGHTTELLAAVDTRIEVACIQGYFNFWTDQIMDQTHCNCNYIPHLLQYFEQDDVCGLICPRPLLVTTGTEDTVAPVESFRRAYASLQAIYQDREVPDRLQQHIFEGGHRFNGEKAFDFFATHLST